MQSYVGDLEALHGVIAYRADVRAIECHDNGMSVRVGDAGSEQLLVSRELINAAGLDATLLAAQTAGLIPESVPRRFLAKGHYYSLTGPSPFHHLIYPVAVAGGLGVHVTLDQSGAARFGPDVEWVNEVDYHFDNARRSAFVAAIRRYYPALDERRLQPGYTGIRPKICGPGEPNSDQHQGNQDRMGQELCVCRCGHEREHCAIAKNISEISGKSADRDDE